MPDGTAAVESLHHQYQKLGMKLPAPVKEPLAVAVVQEKLAVPESPQDQGMNVLLLMVQRRLCQALETGLVVVAAETVPQKELLQTDQRDSVAEELLL